MYFQNTVSVVPIYSPNDRAQNWLIFKLSNIFDSQREACFEILVNTEVKQTVWLFTIILWFDNYLTQNECRLSSYLVDSSSCYETNYG